MIDFYKYFGLEMEGEYKILSYKINNRVKVVYYRFRNSCNSVGNVLYSTSNTWILSTPYQEAGKCTQDSSFET